MYGAGKCVRRTPISFGTSVPESKHEYPTTSVDELEKVVEHKPQIEAVQSKLSKLKLRKGKRIEFRP
jgi:ribosomal protein L5